MLRMACIAAASAALLLSADVPRMQLPVSAQTVMPANPGGLLLAAFPSVDSTVDNPMSVTSPTVNVDQTPPGQASSQPVGPMQEESRLKILRSVDGEFARMVTPLPGSRKGFHAAAGQPLNQGALRKAIRSSGAALNTGDSVQITKLDFLSSGIVVELNGGGNAHHSWRQHLQMQVGIGLPVETGTTTTDDHPPLATQKSGATFYLDFNRPLPDLTPDQVKKYLSVIMDFSKQRSAAVQWTDSLPPQVQDAIRDKRAIVGMDREEVLAAMGRPDRKVRERDAQGNDIEDWIYGHPPSPTTFVRFLGEKVSQIDQYQ